MNIQDALKETGVATVGNWIINWNSLDGYFQNTHPDGKIEKFTFGKHDIQRDDWLPYREENEIRPEKAGELWVHDRGGSFYTYEGNYGNINTIHISGCAMPKDFIHGKNGWKRVFPSVEDENVERIEIEDVSWKRKEGIEFKNGFSIIPVMPYTGSPNLQDIPVGVFMKMILEIPRKDGKP